MEGNFIMSISSVAGNQCNLKNCSIMPKEKNTRQVVREEIKRAQKLEQLKAKYKAGEISDFEYKAQKYMLEHMPVQNQQIGIPFMYSTTA